RGMAGIGKALVVGGGIMGLCSARALRRAGWAVEVLEQDTCPNPRGSSVDHHRLIRHAYGAERVYMRMVDRAHRAWDSLFAAIGETPYIPTGTLMLADARDSWLAASRATLGPEGHRMEEIPPAALTARFPMLDPAGLAEAAFLPTGGVLLAERIVAGLARHLEASGVTLRRARVEAVDPERGQARLADGTVAGADLLVLAAGPWTARLLPELAPRATPSRQIVVFLEPPAAHRAAWEAGPMVLDLSPSGGFYAVPPVAGTPLKIGDHRFSLRGDPDDPREASPAEAEEILALARPRLRDAGGYRVLGARACYYEVAPEERIALARPGERCLALCGTSGHGFKFGPVLGDALAAAAATPEHLPVLAAWVAGQAEPPPDLLPGG
ncbi:FAD-dependent oxidoreductase, partial [Roseomonas mucosa]